MNLTVKGRNIVVTDALNAYAGEKIGRLHKYLTEGARFEVELSTEKNPSIADNQVAEATIHTKGPVIRGREASGDMYASIDLVADKLERQVKKYRGKLVARSQGGAGKDVLVSEGLSFSDDLEIEDDHGPVPTIVKIKQFMVKPMTPEEAALQMDLVGHDFFVFMSSETQETAVVYRRRDGDYGLIEPQR